MLRRNGPVKAVESVLRPEGRLWWERFVKKVVLYCLQYSTTSVLDLSLVIDAVITADPALGSMLML